MESLPPRTVTRLYPKKTKQRRLLRAVLAAFALLAQALTPAAGQAQEPLSLLVFDRPPYYQLQHGQPSGGFLLTTALNVFAQAGIPVTVREMPPGRVVAMLKDGPSRACAVGWYKTTEREAFARFSEPLYRNQPTTVAVRATLPVPETCSPFLADLLAAGWHWGLREGFSYGAEYDQLLAAYPTTKRFADTAHMVELLAKDRLDAILVEPEELAWILAAKPALRKHIRIVRLADSPLGGRRHIMCGLGVSPGEMARLDAAIESYRATPQYQGLIDVLRLTP
ncbi:MAG: periplasmic component of amino acid ABC-type transporter/signal transduction system [Solidesulfovibrio magneticus str. Maddingley MBC34]|uniref:Periplasmic component of amino acid ABC-type transporter/signal transduction system n=1 Tax=Solidesulfovibrio magneticus str. Maddingley MBC34 TaxID=1206767 RepID=K6GM23_9BACT|nr:MAG: periplasmic component of amino acid ABC-type transporter/signal transduction system [Solidesulfovibrio magneticus str. Maddingley MBC34]